jgi:Fe-S-cluster containining protein
MSTTRHNPCATCGRCCRSYVVPVCGYDVWLISTTQRLSPASFLVACPQQEPTGEGFRLERDGPTFFLALDKQGRFAIKAPCVFLVRLAGGHERCGIYGHRPVVCQAYPMQPGDGGLRQRPDALCPPGAWPEATLAWPAWRLALQRQRMHFDVYAVVIARWNERVARAEPGDTFRLQEFSSYLLNVYDRLAALGRQMGAAAMAEIERTWGSRPGATGDGQEVAAAAGPAPWLDYLLRVRAVVERFYPELPPLRPPPQAVGSAAAAAAPRQ